MSMNKFLNFGLGFFISVLLISCNEMSPSEFGNGRRYTPPGSNTQVQFDMPHVRYPAAIVYEGGVGNPYQPDGTSSMHAKWRIYVCLENSPTSIMGKLHIDLNSLGQIFNRSFETNHVFLYSERLSDLDINYNYWTKLSADPDHNYGYAYGQANVTTLSTQNWQTTEVAPGTEVPPHNSSLDLSIFNLRQDYATGAANAGTYTYTRHGDYFYFSSRIENFFYDRNTQTVRIVKVCEDRQSPQVFLTESEIQN